jgi:hypothetical protein
MRQNPRAEVTDRRRRLRGASLSALELRRTEFPSRLLIGIPLAAKLGL